MLTVLRRKSKDSAGASPVEQTAMMDSAASVASVTPDMLARHVVQRGLCTQEEVDRVSSTSLYAATQLGDKLIRASYLTRTQLERAMRDLSAYSVLPALPGFEMLEMIGRGAAATVYKARQLSLDRVVAVKIIAEDFATDSGFMSRLMEEGRATAKLSHPHIVQAFDVGHVGRFNFLVMELVEGRTLADIIKERQVIPEDEALDIVIHVAEALGHAHQQGFVHRDVKPANILITSMGVPKLADLGLARAFRDYERALSEKGRARGTPNYMSPEQVRGSVNIGPQADIYALGATFYHMITGAVPFYAPDSPTVMRMHLEDELVPPSKKRKDISEGVSEVIEKMMAKDRKGRYQSCAELLVELRAWKGVATLRRGERSR